MSDSKNDSTDKLLKVVIALLLRQLSPEAPQLREQIAFLYNLDMKPADIAEILGRSNKYVSKEVSLLNKQARG